MSKEQDQKVFWKLLRQGGSAPCPRSGHSFNQIGNSYVMFGGISAELKDRASPNNDVYTLRQVASEFMWTKEKPRGDAPLPRAHHASCDLPKDRLLIFGGYFSSTQRFNDVFILDLPTMTWSQPPGHHAVNPPDNSESKNGGPEPRAHSTASLIRGKVYIFGGYGGVQYQRKAFNDIHTLDINTWQWAKIEAIGQLPEPRLGHVSCVINSSIIIFGGCSNNTQFNNCHLFDTNSNEWKDIELTYGMPRWNMSAIFVEAIPSNKFFVFGGSIGEFDEGSQRNLGKLTNDIFVLDINSMSFEVDSVKIMEELTSMPEEEKVLPKPREHAALIFDKNESRLIVFGGWNGNWLGDLYSLSVSKIVGPPYAVTGCEPCLGPLTGKTKIIIKGVGFSETSQINVKFICAKNSLSAPGIYISETEISCETPSFETIGPKEAEIRVSIRNGAYTITWTKFTYFMNTRAHKSLAFGPGLLKDGSANQPTVFFIQSRNDLGENRRSGSDKFIIHVKKGEEEIPYEIVDNNNGMYNVSYTPPEGELSIEVLFEDEKLQTSHIRGSPFTPAFKAGASAKANDPMGPLMSQFLASTLGELEAFIQTTQDGINIKGKQVSEDVKMLLKVKKHIEEVEEKGDQVVLKMDVITEALSMYERENNSREADARKLKKLSESWGGLQKKAKEVKKDIAPSVATESDKCKGQIRNFEEELKTYSAAIKKKDFQKYDIGVVSALKLLQEEETKMKSDQAYLEELEHLSKNFGFPEAIIGCSKQLEQNLIDITTMKQLWDHTEKILKTYESYLATTWPKITAADWEEDNKKLMKDLREIKVDRKCNAFAGITTTTKTWSIFLPLITQLKEDCMMNRHWEGLKKTLSHEFTINENFKLQKFFEMELYKFSEPVEDIVDQARNEAKMEKTLKKIKETWDVITFDKTQHKNTDIYLLRVSEENFELLEEAQVQVQNMFASRYLQHFEKEVVDWQKALSSISDNTTLLSEVERSWSFLENLFIGSEEVKKELPTESERFIEIDKEVKNIIKNGNDINIVKIFCNQPDIGKTLEKVQSQLAACERALNEFLNRKREAFPRFYFVSTMDLLDILSNGNNPTRIMRHMSKVFLAVQELKLLENPGERPSATEMISCVGTETVKLHQPLKLVGKVEVYLADMIEAMRECLKLIVESSLKRFAESKREDWLRVDPSQVTLLVSLMDWVNKVEDAFIKLPTDASSLKTYHQNVIGQLTGLIKLVQGDLPRPTRVKVMNLITMDTHSRDIVDKLNNEKVTRADEFQWQSQLKAYYNPSNKESCLRVCDATLIYGYEYLGNGARLVVTPLTDRIYVTATQALHLKMGCSPAGPAGTGKTETTKDLAAASGKACYVFNCSDQMDYKSMGDIYKGLAASGSWGCFDEFNRLVPEVLSVCSVQFRAVTNAIRANKKRFELEGSEVALDPTCGVFITMNPGYLGRSELPEGLKALFRPITVVVPDLELICENMLMAEGFVDAKKLARKFTVLYALCKDLLSKQMHYDWGLRAIKSVLVVAGGFKRAEPNLAEDALLMRALRDFNIPKIVEEDSQIFHGLIGDLFPGVKVNPKVDLEFENVIQNCLEEAKLYPERESIKKVVQLSELLEIRHCVFVMGPAGAGKSSTWKMLAKAQDKVGKKTTAVDMNPKSISTNELYGHVLMSTREWKDGILSKTMRGLGEINDSHPKWIVLDGDLDANWIESMNSVMDDNKILTLASNERIPLKPHMRMLFEIRDLKFASPATVSRAGILFISDTSGYQWRSYYKAWIAKSTYDEATKDGIGKLFERYMKKTLSYLKKSCIFIVPVVDINLVVSLCSMLESLLIGEIKALEYWFVFCMVWAIGGALGEKDSMDYRKNFSNWWKGKWKTIKFPGKGTIFDYYVNYEASKFEEWGEIVPTMEFDSSQQKMNYITVPTPETVSNSYFIEAFIRISRPVLLIGNAGCGKTQLCKGILRKLDPEQFCNMVINFNFYTDSSLLQVIMEQPPIEKKTGKQFAPPGKMRLIYFIDDLNMPKLDDYNTQTAIALLRQHMDYTHWFDRSKLTIKEIINTQVLACMNPTAGSFYVNPRYQRHFWHINLSFPEASSLFTIYNTFATGHFTRGFKASVQEIISPIIKAAISLHPLMVSTFRKTAINFHYEFSIRHLANIFQGLLVAQPSQFQDPEKIIRLWIHESERIYGDRLVSKAHFDLYKGIMGDLIKKTFAKFTALNKFFQKEPDLLVFCHFAGGLVEKIYEQVQSVDSLFRVLDDALKEYNDLNAAMDLVLFEDAMKHVCRISRIIMNTSGHALLIGVGGSGKQSLSRLASFICGYTTSQITISQTYSINDLKADLQVMFNKAGLKDEGILFLFTEGQITNEKFLVYINDLLSSGEIADLFSVEEKDNIYNTIRTAAKGAGIPDTRENCLGFYIDRVKNNLHMALCFSPVGDSFRGRSRKFPAIVNCTVIDWFHDWPREALLSVASRFLSGTELGDEAVTQGVIEYMPFSFNAVNQASVKYKEIEKRFCYTTPKSFLELIKLFNLMISKRREFIISSKERLENGLIKLIETAEVVAKLEEDLKVKTVEVEEKKASAEIFAAQVLKEKTIVTEESAKANIEAEECEKIQKEVEEKKASCETDLAKAIPLLEQAQEALNGLQKKDFGEMKGFAKPPAGVDDVAFAVMALTVTIDPNVQADRNGGVADKSWKAAQKMMGNPDAFKNFLQNFKDDIDSGRVPDKNFKAVRYYLGLEHFNAETMKNKSTAARGLCEWVRNIVDYYDCVKQVEPKREALRQATNQLAQANEKLQVTKEMVAELELRLKNLVDQYDSAIAEKEAVEREAERCARRLNLANRLVNALASEKDRWSESIDNYGKQLSVLVGDVLISSSFVSYVGPFTKKYRDQLIKETFLQFLIQKKIPMSPNPNPLSILTDEATIAKWNNQKLPADSVSIENGTILTSTERWPLIIDPQLQGIAWLTEKEKDNNLQITRLSYKSMIRTMEQAIDMGYSVILENLEESIDAVLSPVVARNFIRRGKTKLLKLGDKEISWSPKFKLIMHTKLSNPHYPPEIQAEAVLINFTVTQDGLEDQLLNLVVKKERPDLAKQKEELIQQQNTFKIKLKELEEDLLFRLTNAKGDVLEDVELIENLETSKRIAEEVKEKMEIAKITEIKIVKASEEYRPAASRGALIFFMMNELFKIHSFYRFSLESYLLVVMRAIDIVAEKYRAQSAANKQRAKEEGGEEKPEEGAAPAEGAKPEEAKLEIKVEENKEEEEEMVQELSPRSLRIRVDELKESITYQSFIYTRRGLFEIHKLLIATMLCFRILLKDKKIDEGEYASFINGKPLPDVGKQPDNLNFLTEYQWGMVKALDLLTVFQGLASNMESDYLQWKKWFMEEKAEIADLPRNFKDISSFHKLLLIRAMRPDRITSALSFFVRDQMGNHYMEQMPFSMYETFKETSKMIPVFFVLFPGVDPTPEVENVAETLDITAANGKFKNISMGQGQEKNAEVALNTLSEQGGWVMLQNVHLMQTWLKTLEATLEKVSKTAHENFRCFISSEPPAMPEMQIVPESILQNCVKVANEAPQDLKANLRRAYAHFDQNRLNSSKKSNEFKALLFALCMFHALVLGRRKFGFQGWSKPYSFNDGDLTICADILDNYLEKYDEVPYADLRYLYGEIMYGGHITDNWDRRTCNTYLMVLIKPELLSAMPLAPAFRSPDPSKFDFEAYSKYIEEKLPIESPPMFGMHPNAEINYLTATGDRIFATIIDVSGGAGGGDQSKKKEDIVMESLIMLKAKLPPEFKMIEITAKTKERPPFVVVCLQECERMNLLLSEIRISLTELEMGLQGALNITEKMEALGLSLSVNRVPKNWEEVAYFSRKPLILWFTDLLERVKQLEEWSSELELPKSLWISGLFNPMSLLTSVMQTTARAKNLPLDNMTLHTTITNVNDHNEIQAYPENGAYIHGYFLEGAGWEPGRSPAEEGYLTDSTLKDLHPRLPVVNVLALPLDEKPKQGFYECPVYVTTQRGPTYIYTASLKMESEEADPKKWVLAGVALLQSDD
ncbi:hypothetical protein SteCoe_16405 [Stentor coeruleus]|uniref:AAA+ ATPase domain-containing protein n=1 Tax=Stentor coeruleus TaxID=5963 RepID=A0A1R2C1A6_9CILI|nr:hypothetical protein SteCoe_16405 [Stentor coeruleus]